jgi:hypothetical protein
MNFLIFYPFANNLCPCRIVDATVYVANRQQLDIFFKDTKTILKLSHLVRNSRLDEN